MFKGSLLRRTMLILLGALTTVACTRVYRVAVVIDAPDSVAGRLQIAQSIATESRLGQLRLQLKERFPFLSPSQLEGLGLSWNQTTFQSFTGQGSGTTVSVLVTLRFEAGLDPVPIVNAAGAIIESEVRTRTHPVPTPGQTAIDSP